MSGVRIVDQRRIPRPDREILAAGPEFACRFETSCPVHVHPWHPQSSRFRRPSFRFPFYRPRGRQHPNKTRTNPPSRPFFFDRPPTCTATGRNMGRLPKETVRPGPRNPSRLFPVATSPRFKRAGRSNRHEVERPLARILQRVATARGDEFAWRSRKPFYDTCASSAPHSKRGKCLPKKSLQSLSGRYPSMRAAHSRDPILWQRLSRGRRRRPKGRHPN